MTADSNPALERLDALVGEWEMVMSIGEQTLSGGRATFEWIEDEDFLVYRGKAEETSELAAELGENSPLPTVSIIGVDGSTEQFTMLYSDARGVFRVYEMTLSNEEWELWRDAPGFSQRFTGTFTDDGDTITGTWEKSEDGTGWEHDFDLSYVKVG